jgi:hypothetical protein
LTILNMGDQQTISDFHQTTVEFAEPQAPLASQARTTSEANQVNQKLDSQVRLVPLSIAHINASSGVAEERLAEDVRTSDEYISQVQTTKVNTHVAPALVKPPIPKKPVLLNKGWVKETKFVPESTNTIPKMELPLPELARTQRHDEADMNLQKHVTEARTLGLATESELNVHKANQVSAFQRYELEQAHVSAQLDEMDHLPKTFTSVTTLNMSRVDRDNSNSEATQEITTSYMSTQPETVTNVTKVDHATHITGLSSTGPCQVFESVKPMDTIELEFEEHFTTVTTTTTTKFDETITVEKVAPLHSARSRADIVCDEKCSDLYVESVRDVKLKQADCLDELQAPTFVHKKFVDKIGLGNYKTEDILKTIRNQMLI